MIIEERQLRLREGSCDAKAREGRTGRPDEDSLGYRALDHETGDQRAGTCLHHRTRGEVGQPTLVRIRLIEVIHFDDRSPCGVAHAGDLNGVGAGFEADDERRVFTAINERKSPDQAAEKFHRDCFTLIGGPIIVLV